jgi:hypothetical protein
MAHGARSVMAMAGFQVVILVGQVGISSTARRSRSRRSPPSQCRCG